MQYLHDKFINLSCYTDIFLAYETSSANLPSHTLVIKLLVFLVLFAQFLFLVGAAPAAVITVADRMDQIAPMVRERLRPWFVRQRIKYPPSRVALVAVKDEQRLKVYASDHTGDWRFVMQYKIAKLSGKSGPKLRAGDNQVPEGVYDITALNPQSKFWLSLALNYPNAFDRQQAKRDKRSNLGGDIMIHGWWFSTGCVAVGNTAAEDLFVLVKDTGVDDAKIVITPTDFRSESSAKQLPSKPEWVTELYKDIKEELNALGSDGLTTESKLIAYSDIAPPPPPEPTTIFGKILRALSEAAITSSTETNVSN